MNRASWTAVRLSFSFISATLFFARLRLTRSSLRYSSTTFTSCSPSRIGSIMPLNSAVMERATSPSVFMLERMMNSGNWMRGSSVYNSQLSLCATKPFQSVMALLLSRCSLLFSPFQMRHAQHQYSNSHWR